MVHSGQNSLHFADAVSQTLLIPLWAKAEESKRRDGVLRDTTAGRVVSLLPLEAFDFPKKAPMMVGSAIRSRYFDDKAGVALERDNSPVLVHLGCGLDDRFGRTDMGKGIQINIDLPDVMDLRQKLMPSENERNIDWKGSLRETLWMSHLKTAYPAGQFTFFMEGLLMYFPEEDVQSLFVRLANRFPGATIHFDACSNRMCAMINRHKAISQTNARMQWGLDDARSLERWHPTLTHRITDYYFDQYRHRWGYLSLMRFVPYFGKGSTLVTYTIDAV